MKNINKTLVILIGAMVGLILLFIIAEHFFTSQRQSGWETLVQGRGISTLAIDPQGRVWVNRPDMTGFAYYDGKSWRELPFPSDVPEYFFSLAVAPAFDHKGRLWVDTTEGVAVLSGDAWTVYTPQNSALPDPVVDSIFEDAQHQIWVSTRGGFAVFDGEKLSSHSQPTPTLPDAEVADVTLDSLGHMWLVLRRGYTDCYLTTGEGISNLSTYDGKVWTNYDWKQMGFKQPYSIQAIAADQQNRIWVGTSSGLHVFDGKAWKTILEETVPADKPGHYGEICVEDLAVDPQGKLWMVAYGGKLGIFDGEKWLRLDEQNLSTPFRGDKIAIDPRGRTWIADDLYNGGLWSASTEHPPIVPSGLWNFRFWFYFSLGGVFLILLAITFVKTHKEEKAPSWFFLGLLILFFVAYSFLSGEFIDISLFILCGWNGIILAAILGLIAAKIPRLTNFKLFLALFITLILLNYYYIMRSFYVQNDYYWDFLLRAVLCFPALINYMIVFGCSKLKIHWAMKIGIAIASTVFLSIVSFFLFMG